MHLSYGVAGQIGPRVVQIYSKCYLNRRKSQHEVFAGIYQHLCESVSVTNTYDRTGNQLTCTDPIKEAVKQSVQEQPSFCI